MANTAIKGFQPYAVKGGGSITLRRGRVLTNNTTAIFLYDAVVRVGTGDYVVASTTTTATEGSSQGCVYTDAAGIRREAKYLPAATLYTSTTIAPDNASYIYLVDNLVNTAFRASVDTVIALTDLNLNFAMTLSAGSTTTGLSGHLLAASGRNTTATLPWRVENFEIGSPIADVDGTTNQAVICYANTTFDEPALSASTGA